MESSTLEDRKVFFQESIIIHISMLFNDGEPTGALFAGGDLFNDGDGSYQACIGGDNNNLFDVLAELDNALDTYQNDHPYLKLIEICSDDVIEAMNLMLEERRLKPINEDVFNFSDVLFNIGNPVLARQLGYGL